MLLLTLTDKLPLNETFTFQTKLIQPMKRLLGEPKLVHMVAEELMIV